MAEFRRSRLKKTRDDSVTRKTVFLGVLTVFLFVVIVIFGLPLLVRFSVFLGNTKDKNEGESSIQVLPPMAPRLILPYEATSSARISVKGLAEPGVMVELLKNDVAVEKLEVSEEGEFSFDGVDLLDGENEFCAIAMTEDGGSSDLSKVLMVVFDNEEPDLIMENPSEDKLTVDYDDFDIAGRAESGASVLVNGRVAIVDDDGGFKIKMQLQAGENEFEVIVRDMAGNETRKKMKITYDI